MDDTTDYIELVTRAQFGDKQSLNDLAELVRGRLYAYVYRITLQDDLTQDIVQESMLEMFKVIDTLEKTDRFWPWLRGIAFNKIRHHRAREQRHKTVSISNIGADNLPLSKRKDRPSGLANLIGDELKQIIFNAMRELKPRHRAVLAMRCYEEMGYSEIAELMDCSELNVRVLFYRAKKALHKQLSYQGLGKKFLLSALALFGKMTAHSEAEAAGVSITVATTEVGLAAGLVGMATSKTTVVALAAAGLLAVSSTVAIPQINRAVSWFDKTMAVLGEKLTKDLYVTAGGREDDKEFWYYYPAGVNGPVMTRLMKWDPRGQKNYCQRLENDRANYNFDIISNSMYIENSRMLRSDFGVRRLPTDKSNLREFLSRVEGKADEMEYISSEGDGLLVISKLGEDINYSLVTHHYNVLDEEYFRYDWPRGVKVVDNRDAMHKRAWTYFRLTGHMNGEEISGTGRIPFVYDASKQNYPWLRLKVGERLKIVDSGAAACVYGQNGRLRARYEGGSFFAGLGRPWMGLHTVDTVRRDAAEKQIWFETKHTPGSNKAEVILTKEQEDDSLGLIYTIDLDNDVIEKITFSAGEGHGRYVEGELIFSYLEDIDQVGAEFAEPREKSYKIPQREGIGMLWLVRLAEADLG